MEIIKAKATILSIYIKIGGYRIYMAGVITLLTYIV